MSEQERQIRRVDRNIGDLVLAFCQSRREFHLHELEAYVKEHHARSTPGSGGRILRQLKKQGKVNYEVLNRSLSHYRITSGKPYQMGLF